MRIFSSLTSQQEKRDCPNGELVDGQANKNTKAPKGSSLIVETKWSPTEYEHQSFCSTNSQVQNYAEISILHIMTISSYSNNK